MGVIFCDLDDVIADTEGIIVKYAQKYNSEVLGRENEDEYHGCSRDYFYFLDKFQWTEKEMKSFFLFYYPKYLREIPCIGECKEYIKKIVNMGHEFNVISARFHSEKMDVYKLTFDWLVKNEIPFDNLFINQQKKDVVIAQYKDVLAFIDDSVQNCIDVRKNTNCKNVVLYEKKYNYIYSALDYIKVKNWREIYKIICNYS